LPLISRVLVANISIIDLKYHELPAHINMWSRPQTLLTPPAVFTWPMAEWHVEWEFELPLPLLVLILNIKHYETSYVAFGCGKGLKRCRFAKSKLNSLLWEIIQLFLRHYRYRLIMALSLISGDIVTWNSN